MRGRLGIAAGIAFVLGFSPVAGALAAEKKGDPWAGIVPVVPTDPAVKPPRFDVEGLCYRQSTLWDKDKPNAGVRLNCLRQQQGAYDALKETWAAYSAAIRQVCLEIARSENASGGRGDYDLLLSCITREDKKARDGAAVAKFRFKE